MQKLWRQLNVWVLLTYSVMKYIFINRWRFNICHSVYLSGKLVYLSNRNTVTLGLGDSNCDNRSFQITRPKIDDAIFSFKLQRQSNTDLLKIPITSLN